MKSDDRQRILARRAKLVAAALATLGAGACQPSPEGPPPGPCLSVQPQPCLEPPPPPSDTDAGPEDPPPQVCLSQPYIPEKPDKPQGPYADPPPDES